MSRPLERWQIRWSVGGNKEHQTTVIARDCANALKQWMSQGYGQANMMFVHASFIGPLIKEDRS